MLREVTARAFIFIVSGGSALPATPASHTRRTAPRCLAHEPETGVCESVCGTQTSEPGVAYLSCHGGPRISGTSVKRGIPLLHPSTPHSLRSSASRTTKETVAPHARVARPCQHVTHCLHVTHQFTCSSWSSRVSRAP